MTSSAAARFVPGGLDGGVERGGLRGVAFQAAAVFGQLAAAAFDEFGQLGAAGVHRLALAAQALVALLLGGDAQTEFVEGFGEGVFLRADGFGRSAAVARSAWWPSQAGRSSASRFSSSGDACLARSA